MQKKTWLMVIASVVLVVVAIGCLAVLQPWNASEGSDGSLYDDLYPQNASSEEDIALDVDDNGLSENGKVVIAGEEIDYTPGEYGAVVVEEIFSDEFSSPEAFAEYEQNWHDRSWYGEMPTSGRNKYASFESEEKLRWVAGELVVVFAYEIPDERIYEIADQNAAKVGKIECSDVLEDYKTSLFYYADDAIDPFLMASSLHASAEEVEAAFPNVIGSSTKTVVTDTLVDDQIYLEESGFTNAWDKVKCSVSVAVAVLDSGIDFSHPDLVGNIDVDYAYDAINSRPLSSETEDKHKHGTSVAGIVAAEANNSRGIAGCSYNARILPIKTLNDDGNGDVFSLSSALQYLIEHPLRVDVVNMSFGFQVVDWWQVVEELEYGLLCQGKIDYLVEEFDVVFVAAAGNQGEEGNYVEYPAALDNVISVASVDQNLLRASSSTANSTVDICAIGEGVYTTLPKNIYGSVGGTSFAAPQVAAAAALLKVQNPTWSSERIENKLELSARRLDAMTSVDSNGKDTTGQYGYGFLDVAKAVGFSNGTSGGSHYTGGVYEADSGDFCDQG